MDNENKARLIYEALAARIGGTSPNVEQPVLYAFPEVRALIASYGMKEFAAL